MKYISIFNKNKIELTKTQGRIIRGENEYLEFE